jgi:hypothetical protein
MRLNVPGPGNYQIINGWQGKNPEEEKKKLKNWMNRITKGPS